MNADKKSYLLPTRVPSGLSYQDVLDDLEEFQKVIQEYGLRAINTRIDRYIKFLSELANGVTPDGNKIFKNSQGEPFNSDIDWFFYIFREVHELQWILKGIKVYKPPGLAEKLEKLVGGRDFAALDQNSVSRDTQFELRIASYFCQTGWKVDLSSNTDVVVSKEKRSLFLECKRLGSEVQLSKRLSEARCQLRERMPKKYKGNFCAGLIALDITKAAYSHNGITFGVTPDHSRDHIQEKIQSIISSDPENSLFSREDRVVSYWYQVHIANMNMHPQILGSRFSSVFLFKPDLARKERSVLGCFKEAFEAASSNHDVREPPEEHLRLRSGVEIPAGSIFSFDEVLLKRIQDGEEVGDLSEDKVVGKIVIDGVTHQFGPLDLLMVLANKQELPSDPVEARLHLVACMYLWRYPYENPS